MEQGKRLKDYLKSMGLSQKEILDKSSFSKGKLYSLYKMGRFLEEDRLTIISDFNLESDFFDHECIPTQKNFQKMYYELLEKHTQILEELNECRNEQIKLIADAARFSVNSPNTVYKSELKKNKS